jgi:hypothetical protein
MLGPCGRVRLASFRLARGIHRRAGPAMVAGFAARRSAQPGAQAALLCQAQGGKPGAQEGAAVGHVRCLPEVEGFNPFFTFA